MGSVPARMTVQTLAQDRNDAASVRVPRSCLFRSLQFITYLLCLGLAKTIHTYVYTIYGVNTVFLAGRLPCIWSYAAYIYGSGQP